MTPPPKACTNRRCPHKGTSLSLDYFHKGDSPPDCSTYHVRYSDCRKTRPIPLPSHLPGPSPANASCRRCQKCHREWSSARFPNQHRKEYCLFCMIQHETLTDLLGSRSQVISKSLSPSLSWDPPSSPLSARSQTPPPRSRIREQRFRKSQAGGVDKLVGDFHRRQQLPFHNAVDTAGVLGFNFIND